MIFAATLIVAAVAAQAQCSPLPSGAMASLAALAAQPNPWADWTEKVNANNLNLWNTNQQLWADAMDPQKNPQTQAYLDYWAKNQEANAELWAQLAASNPYTAGNPLAGLPSLPSGLPTLPSGFPTLSAGNPLAGLPSLPSGLPTLPSGTPSFEFPSFTPLAQGA